MLERSECITQPRALLHHLSAPPLKHLLLAKRVIYGVPNVSKLKKLPVFTYPRVHL